MGYVRKKMFLQGMVSYRNIFCLFVFYVQIGFRRTCGQIAMAFTDSTVGNPEGIQFGV